MTVRLGAIAFVNTIPVYLGMAEEANRDGIELVYDVPAKLNAKMGNGELEISPVSSAFYLRNRDKLVLLDDLSVSSPGAVESVIFVSRKPLGPELLDSPMISVPDDSETSVALLAHVLKQATDTDLRPWFKIYEAGKIIEALEETGSALVIGDNALMLQERGIPEGFHCYDLSSLWKDETGLPFVFAVWVANRAWAKENSAQLNEINQKLIDSRDGFFKSEDNFNAGLELAQHKSGVETETLARYFSVCLDYRLSEPHLVSLSRFGQVMLELDGADLSQTSR